MSLLGVVTIGDWSRLACLGVVGVLGVVWGGGKMMAFCKGSWVSKLR